MCLKVDIYYAFLILENKMGYTIMSTATKEYYSVGIGAKQSVTVKNVEHSKNDYHERSMQVPKDWHSGDFDAKWQEKELHK